MSYRLIKRIILKYNVLSCYNRNGGLLYTIVWELQLLAVFSLHIQNTSDVTLTPPPHPLQAPD